MCSMSSNMCSKAEGADTSLAASLLHIPEEVLSGLFPYVALHPKAIHAILVVLRLSRRSDLGPEFSKGVRNWYLKKYAADYIRYLYSYCMKNVKEQESGKTAWLPDNVTMRVRSNLKIWMDVNSNWREACNPYPASGEDVIKGFFADYEAREDTESDNCARALLYKTKISEARHIVIKGSRSLFQVPVENHSVILGIDGKDFRPLDCGVAKDFLWGLDYTGDKSPVKRVRMMPKAMEFFFLNPAVSIDLGTLEIFRYIVEDVEVDIEKQEARFIFYKGVEGYYKNNLSISQRAKYRAHPDSYMYTGCRPDRRFADYLASLKRLKKKEEVAGGDY